ILSPITFSLQCNGQQAQSGKPIEKDQKAQTSPKVLNATPQIDPKQLPKPFQTSSVDNPPDIIDPPEGAQLKFPPGFGVNLFANDLANPRWLAVAPNGDVFVVESMVGRIMVLRDTD